MVLALALIFIGPEKLPDIATALGRLTRKAKEAIDDLKSTLDE